MRERGHEEPPANQIDGRVVDAPFDAGQLDHGPDRERLGRGRCGLLSREGYEEQEGTEAHGEGSRGQKRIVYWSFSAASWDTVVRLSPSRSTVLL